MSYNSVEFSKYVISRLDEFKKEDVKYEYDVTKINKLLYILYGFYWPNRHLRLLDEQPKLWPYGPVFPKVYKNIKQNGFESDYRCSVDENDMELFDKILRNFGTFKASVLSDWSHERNSPWDQARMREINKYGESRWSETLNDVDIQIYFSHLSYE